MKVMNKNLIKMLKTSAEADKAKALLTLDLLGNTGVGIGDHSTKDFYENAEIEWFFDIYFIWMLYNPRNYDRYVEYIEKKWGNDNEQ